MKKVAAILLGVSLVFAGSAFAKSSFVPGAKCNACHEGKPAEKKLNAKAQEMVKKYKVEECKNCHDKADGDKAMTSKKK
jgi:cytochrome c peroxidase